MASAAGHDINYIALSGALHSIGNKDGKPVPPLNLVGDFGGGGMFLAFGMVCAMLEAKSSGKGQVVDTSMVEGAGTLMAMFFSMRAAGVWKDERATNMLDGGAHFYDTYETQDGRYVSLGSIEPQFYALLIEKAGLKADEFTPQMDMARWPQYKEKLTEVFKQKTRDQWTEIMEGTDVCFAPVLSLGEVQDHPHNKARQSFVELDGVVQPAPAPRFSRTSASLTRSSRLAGEDSLSVLADAGYSTAEVDSLLADGAISLPPS
jgi:alpha-methylacyl-CoA racemase